VGAEVRANDVVIRYKEWLKFNPGKKVMQKGAVLEKLAELYGTPIDGKTFAGLRIAVEGEDVSGNIV